MKNKISTAIVGNMIRVHLAETTELVQTAQKIHDTSTLSTEAFSKVLTASSILGNMLKNVDDVLTFKIAGSNLIKTILVTANYKGNVKGYISNPHVEDTVKRGKNSVSSVIGKDGNLTLIRDMGLKEPYVGISKLKTGEIDEDLAFYFESSEQLPTEISLGTIMNGKEVVTAGGIMIQIIPGITEKEKIKIAEVSHKIFDVVDLIHEGMSAEAIIKHYFGDLNVEMLGEYEVNFKCDCSLERISKALITVGNQELKDILEHDRKAELTCHFCNTKYTFNEEDLMNIIKALDEK